LKAETWYEPYGARPDKRQQAKKLGLLEGQKLIGTPANPDCSGGNAAKMLF